MSDRQEITSEEISETVTEFLEFFETKIKEKGNGTFSSIHEIRGVLDEEVEEFRLAVKKNDHQEICHELKDVLVSALWGLVSIRTKKVDW